MLELVNLGGKRDRDFGKGPESDGVSVELGVELIDGIVPRVLTELGDIAIQHLKALTDAIGEQVVRLRHEAHAIHSVSEGQNLAWLPTSGVWREIVRGAPLGALQLVLFPVSCAALTRTEVVRRVAVRLRGPACRGYPRMACFTLQRAGEGETRPEPDFTNQG